MFTIKAIALTVLLASVVSSTSKVTLSPNDGTSGGPALEYDAPVAIDLKTVGNYAILSQTGVTAQNGVTVVGDIGTSPIALAAVTGFSLTVDNEGAFATSGMVTGKVYAADLSGDDTTSDLQTAVFDMGEAYDAAAGVEGPTLVPNAELGGHTIAPGLYKFGGAVGLTGELIFDAGGDPDKVWILQIPGGFSSAAFSKMVLEGGAQAKNIFWQIAGAASVGASSHLEGVFLVKTSMAFGASSSLNGAVLAQTACTMAVSVTINRKTVDYDPPSSPVRKLLRA